MCLFACIVLIISPFAAHAQSVFDTAVKPADARPSKYLPLLKHRRVALVINQTSMIGDQSLLDLLISKGITIKKIFVPEHGFRGHEDAGAHIDNTVDSATGIPVISLYGNHKKPTAEDLADIDVLVYDLQDVGVRFYTYISTLEYCLEACAQNHKEIIVLDRPDPNGFYVDGPVLEKENKSFIGMQPIPVVYGMTPGEYAEMLTGERWYANAVNARLEVIKCTSYDHTKKYELPVSPSPNLRTMAAIYAYPSMCLFEGTPISVGRGTALPFQQYGSPELAAKYTYTFTPVSGFGSKDPPYQDRICYGEVTAPAVADILHTIDNKFHLDWLVNAYNACREKEKFFTPFFIKLSGTTRLSQQIKEGMSADAIHAGWQSDINAFKQIRRKYLLYKDFE